MWGGGPMDQLRDLRGFGPNVRIVGRAIVMIGVIVACFALLAERFAFLQWSDVVAAIADTPGQAIGIALIFGLFSHAALAGYDLLAFSRIGRHVPWPRALKGGFSGTVVGQVLGFGLITGALARARIYRANAVGAAEAVALSGFVAAGFFTGLGVLLALFLLIDPSIAAQVTGVHTSLIRVLAGSGLAIFALAGILGSLRPCSLNLGRLSIRMPDAAWMAKSTILAAADLIPAALCLAVLLPAEALPSLTAFVAIYVTGVALGHLLGSPGAAGPFEAVLFLTLPAGLAPELAAGILLYRLVYYVPAFLAALILIARAPKVPETVLETDDRLRDRVAWIMDETHQAEAELVLLGDKHIYCLSDGEGFVAYGISGRIWLVMGDPVGPRRAWDALIAGLEVEARAAGAVLVAYKATTTAHPVWQARGYQTHSLGEEATLTPADWTLDGSDKRELRRKIKATEKAGIALCRHDPGEHPLMEMAQVAEAWRAGKGHEQTFSMGHWSPAFNSRHMVVSAWSGDGLTAFATFWVSGDGSEWMLDLIRQRPNTPNGTMYAILAEAIAFARERGAERFNLCIAPLSGLGNVTPSTWASKLGHAVYLRGNAHHHFQGMRRFKDVFRPDWSPRALVVPNAAVIPEALLAAHALVNGRGNPILHAGDRTPLMAPPFYQPNGREAAVTDTRRRSAA